MYSPDYFKDKRVTVMGLGLLGRGVGDALFLAECGAEVIVTDLKTEVELQDSFNRLKGFSNVRFVLGEHRLEDFAERDMILVSAGVPMDSEYLAHARGAGVRLVQSAALFAELSDVPIIGVTGTRGKSTVTMMIHHVLSFITGEPVLLGGNIRGVSNLQLLNEVTEDSLCVMELDSWQLQGWGWAGISPAVSVFTTFMEDHLNYYTKTLPRTSDVLGRVDGVAGREGEKEGEEGREEDGKEEAMRLYFTDKAQIFLHQEDSGTFITTPEIFSLMKKYCQGVTLTQEVVLADVSVLPEDMLLSMPGEHNRLNAALATQALRAVGMTDEEIFEGLATFPGVEGRLQLAATHNNVRIYNDNNATTPQATIAALEALDVGNKNIILIAGGADKKIDVTPLAYAITQHCKNVFLIPGSGTDNLLGYLDGGDMSVSVMAGLSTAFTEAMRAAMPGDVVLFSPAFSSFAQYKNEYERNDEFVRLVFDLLESDLE